jgi:hypothetical protein
MSDPDNATPPAPSLADEVSKRLKVIWDLDKDDTLEVRHVVEAALRAVDELQAWKRQHTEASCTNPLCDCIEAQLSRATRAVEAVRAFPIDPPREPDESCKADPCGWCDGYRDGVGAVQALLEGMK